MMVDNQHKKIQGYRDLSENEIECMNAVKSKEKEVAELWFGIYNQLSGHIDSRWMSIAKTHFEEGFSAFVRAIAQPESPFDA